MRPGHSDKYLWTVTGWTVNRNQFGGIGFGLWVSDEFLQIARNSPYCSPENQPRMAEMAGEIAVNAGFQNYGLHGLLYFSDEWGLIQINSPRGGGCWIALDQNEARGGGGAEWHDHNVDTVADQSLLMAIWMFYVNMVLMGDE